MLLHVDNIKTFEENLNKGRVLVDFYADWCGPCQMLSPLVEDLAKEDNELTIMKVNVDELPELARKYGISSIPSLIYLVDGEIKNRRIGYIPLRDLKKLVS